MISLTLSSADISQQGTGPTHQQERVNIHRLYTLIRRLFFLYTEFQTVAYTSFTFHNGRRVVTLSTT